MFLILDRIWDLHWKFPVCEEAATAVMIHLISSSLCNMPLEGLAMGKTQGCDPCLQGDRDAHSQGNGTWWCYCMDDACCCSNVSIISCSPPSCCQGLGMLASPRHRSIISFPIFYSSIRQWLEFSLIIPYCILYPITWTSVISMENCGNFSCSSQILHKWMYHELHSKYGERTNQSTSYLLP